VLRNWRCDTRFRRIQTAALIPALAAALTLSSATPVRPAQTGALRRRLFDFGKVEVEVAQSRGAYAEALAAYRQAALRATEDIENAFMELMQTQVRVAQLQGEVVSLTRAGSRSFGTCL
jgi:outer membrane protein TolC